MNSNANEKLKLRMAGYVLGLGQAIKQIDGKSELRNRIRLAAQKSGEQKAADLASVPLLERHRALADRLQEMLFEFGGVRPPISIEGNICTIKNQVCPCLAPFVDQALQFGFSREEVHRYACLICMPGYAKAAEMLGLKFKGSLTKRGCSMHFCKTAFEPDHFEPDDQTERPLL